jgi:hypothetical protein
MWRAPASCDGGNCVSVAVSGDPILIRESKKPDDPVHAYSRAEWVAFVEEAKNGDFDDFLSRETEISLGDREVMLFRDEKHDQPTIERSCRSRSGPVHRLRSEWRASVRLGSRPAWVEP